MKRAHFLSVQYRIKYKLCCETFKVLNNISPKYLHDFLTPDFPKRTGLRTSNDFALVKTSNCEKSVSHAMCNEWNKLPHELRIKGKLKDFKSALKTHYFNLYYDWVPNLITNHGCFKLDYYARCIVILMVDTLLLFVKGYDSYTQVVKRCAACWVGGMKLILQYSFM